VSEEDPKDVAKHERYTPGTEKILRQFLTLESGNYATAAYREAYDRIKNPKHLIRPARCRHKGCTYVAECLEDINWHIKQCGHKDFGDLR